jgi:hypothetical protein
MLTPTELHYVKMQSIVNRRLNWWAFSAMEAAVQAIGEARKLRVLI